MKYRLIAIDMDGTLLNSHSNISERNRMVLCKAIEKGVNIVLSTGRIHRSAVHYARLTGLNSPIIACNGAVITSADGKDIIFERYIDNNILRSIVEMAEDGNVYYHFYDLSTFYFRKSEDKFKKYHGYYEENFKDQGIRIIGFNNPVEVLNNTSEFHKLVFIEDDVLKLENLRQKLEKIRGISVCKSWYNNLEIMSEGISKGNALKFLAQMLGIDTSETVAIGDNENDISMLKVAGLAIAMGNGDEIIKKNAHIVTDTNDEDGVAKAIEKYVL